MTPCPSLVPTSCAAAFVVVCHAVILLWAAYPVLALLFSLHGALPHHTEELRGRLVLRDTTTDAFSVNRDDAARMVLRQAFAARDLQEGARVFGHPVFELRS